MEQRKQDFGPGMSEGFGQLIGDLARRLAAAVPPGARALQEDLERNFQALLQSTFARLDLVTREEFDVQCKVLERTRERLAAVEARLAELEGRGAGNPGNPGGPPPARS